MLASHQNVLWGWKGPRSIYFLPFYQAIFKNQWRFLHIIRDGRDVSFGDNQMQFWMLCKFQYNESFCNRSLTNEHRASMHFWADVNTQAFEWGEETLSRRYMVLRVEDLAIATPQVPIAEAAARLAYFISADASTNVLKLQRFLPQNIACRFTPLRADPFGGNKFPEGTSHRKRSTQAKNQILRTLGDAGKEALALFGYQLDSWGRSGRPPGRRWKESPPGQLLLLFQQSARCCTRTQWHCKDENADITF